MKNYVETTLSDVPNDLISISSETSVDKETGETSSFIRIEAEVQKGYDALSRCRFSVKIPKDNRSSAYETAIGSKMNNVFNSVQTL